MQLVGEGADVFVQFSKWSGLYVQKTPDTLRVLHTATAMLSSAAELFLCLSSVN